MNKIYILVYGSLRKGEYNYSSDELTYISTKQIKGYKLYSLGSYPGIKFTGNENDILTCDLMEVKNIQSSNSIDYMELGAGYSINPIIVEDNGTLYPCKIYEYQHSVKENELVSHGDWTKRNEICVE